MNFPEVVSDEMRGEPGKDAYVTRHPLFDFTAVLWTSKAALQQ